MARSIQDWMPTAIARRWGANAGKDSSYGSYLNKNPDLGEGLYALQGDKGEFNPEDDPIYQLDLQAAAARYPGDMGGIASKVANAIAENAYGGPSIESLRAYGREGESTIGRLYGELNSYLMQQAGKSQQNYAASGAATQQGYDKVAADVAQAQADAAKNLQAQGNLGGAGAGAAQEAQAAAKAAIERQAGQIATNKANALAGQQAMQAGTQDIYGQFGAGAEREKVAQTGKWQSQVNSLISNAMQEMAAAQAKQSRAAESARSSGGNEAGKRTAAELNAMKDAIKRAKGEKSEKLTGIQGAMTYALRAKRPDLAKKFVDLYRQSKSVAAAQNQRAKAEKLNPSLAEHDKDNKIIYTAATTPEEQFQALISKAGGPQPIDLGGDVDPRGDIMQLMKDPKLSFLKNYLISDPETARRQGQYQSAFGMNEEAYKRQGKPKPMGGPFGKLMEWKNKSVLTQSLPQQLQTVFGGGPESQSDFDKKMAKQFTPFLNLDLLRRNQGDVSRFYDYFKPGGQDQDLLLQLYDIFQGKYGTG